MLGFGAGKKKRQDDTVQSGESDETKKQRGPQIINKAVSTRFSIGIGRVLSFVINDESIEMAAVSRLGKKNKIIDVRKVYIPRDIDTNEARMTFLEASVSGFVSQHGGRNTEIAISVSGPETSFRTFVMPVLSKKQMGSAVEFEIKKQLPFPVADCYYDYREISQIITPEKQQAKISLQAATRRLVDEKLAPFRKLGIDVSRIYNAADAIGLMLQHMPDFAPDANYALINIEKERSQIAYYRGTTLEFYHYCSLGSSYLSGRQDPGRFDSFAELLSDEIQNSLDYYSGQFSASFSNRVFVYGDLAYSDDLVEQLTDRFGFEFSMFPAEKLKFAEDCEEEQSYSLPVCLPALATATCNARIANLLPRASIEKLKIKTASRYAAAALIVLTVLLGSNWLLHIAEINTAENQLEQLKENIEAFGTSNMYASYTLVQKQVAEERQYLEKVKEEPAFFGLNLKELSILTPPSIRLQDFDLHNNMPDGNLMLGGVIRSDKKPPELILAEYVETLNASPFYDSVMISRYNKKMVEDAFEMDFSLTMTGVL